MASRKMHGISCAVDGCTKPARSRPSRHCEMHYYRMRRSGSLERTLTAHRRERADGYVLIPARGHPRALGKGHAFEHRVVFYDAHGEGPFNCHVCRKVVTWDDMHVDHLNEIKTDNRLENLAPACPACNQWRGKDHSETTRKSPNIHWIEFNGERLPLSAWAKRIGISSAALGFRLHKGWPLEQALTEPRGITGPRR